MSNRRTTEPSARTRRGRDAALRSVCIAAVAAAGVLMAGCSYLPEEANPIEYFKDAREAVSDRKTDEQEQAEAKAVTLPMPNQNAPFPKLSSVPERPDRSDVTPASNTAASLEIDRERAVTNDFEVRDRDADFVVEPRAPVRQRRARAQTRPQTPSSRPPSGPSIPERVRPPPPPDIPDVPERVRPPPPPVIPDAPAPGDGSQLRPPDARPVAATASGSARADAFLVRVAARDRLPIRAVPVRIPPPEGRYSPGPFAGGLEPLPEPRRRPRRRASAPADIVPAIPRDSEATVRPAAEMPKKLEFGPPPSDIEPFGDAADTGRPQTAAPNTRDSASSAGRAAAILASRRTGPAETSVRRVGVVQFPNGSSSVGPSGRGVLTGVAVEQRRQGGTLRIVGHASSGATGERDVVRQRIANLTMSLDRANAVARELVKLGVDPKSIVVSGMADSEPVASESTAAGAARNRRAEIYLGN